MADFTAWWNGLTPLTQWFFGAAAFFSVFFVWQLLSALIGLGGDADGLDSHAGADWHHASPDDSHATLAVFKILSVRSLIAFFMLFTWAAALYLNNGLTPPRAMALALVWGFAAMLIVSAIVGFLRRLTETGNQRISSCIGLPGTVYLDIPAGGDGEARVLCSGILTHYRARSMDGTPIKAGTTVRVTRVLGPNTIEVSTSETVAK